MEICRGFSQELPRVHLVLGRGGSSFRDVNLGRVVYR